MTDLKKISAYVPQRIFDEIEAYAKKENISLSQSIIAGLIAGFDIPEVEIEGRGKKIVISSDRETKEKVFELEQKFEQFSSNITSQIEQILSAVQTTTQSNNRNKAELTTDRKQNINGNSSVKNQSIDKILNSPSTENLDNKLDTDEIADKQPDSIQEKLPSEQQSALSDVKTAKGGHPQAPLTDSDFKSKSQAGVVSPLSSQGRERMTNFEPFSGRLLGVRLGMNRSSVANQKKKTLEKFKAWSEEKDPDNISWIPNPKPNETGYVPSKELTNSQSIKLQQWITTNK